MPANLTPEYKAAEQAFRLARSKEEKIAALEEMLAVIPKHKGTDKLQADLRKRLSKLREAEEKSGSGSQYNPYLVEPQGAGQVVVIGFPNTGKSSLLKTLTNAKAVVADYPFSTSIPQPGMMSYLDIHIQLVDTPPITSEGIPGVMMTTIQNANVLVVVIDAGSEECLSQVTDSIQCLRDRRLLRDERPEGVRAFTMSDLLLVANKCDLPQAEEHILLINELWDGPSWLRVSAVTGEGLEGFRRQCFDRLNVIRIYTKAPGQDPDMDAPFVLPRGSTVLDLAENIHKEVAESLRGARVWGSSKFDGQSVALDYELKDQDIVELRA